MPNPPAPPPTFAPGMQVTALDVISSSLRLINCIATGEAPTAAEASDALLVVNQMLDQWQAERLMVNAIQRLVWPLVSGQQAYQYGIGSPDWNGVRPARIDWMGVITNQTTQPLEIPLAMMTESDWLAIPSKSIGSSLPSGVWDDDGYPLRTLNFWPIPNVTNLQVSVYNWVTLQKFFDLTTKYSFPPGYLQALRYNLAVLLANEFPGQLGPNIVAEAISAKAIVKRMNVPSNTMQCDAALANRSVGVYNFYTDNANIGG